MCDCETRKPVPDELLSEFCVSCGRIWVNTLMGHYRPTDFYHQFAKPACGGMCSKDQCFPIKQNVGLRYTQ